MYKSNSDNVISKLYSSIPNLYQISGCTEAFIRQCVRGGRVYIKERNMHITEPVVDLDINSLYPYAISKLYIQSGKPQILNNSYNFNQILQHEFEHNQVYPTTERFISQAFIAIKVETIGIERTPAVIDNLTVGETYYVDLITLRDLVKYHNVTGKVVEGLYYSGKRHYVLKSFIERLYSERKTNPEMKLEMNKMYGYTLHKPNQFKQKVYPNNSEKLTKYISNHYALFVQAFKDEKNTTVTLYKKWTDNYNMANFGVSILSEQRHIMNELFYSCQDSGIDVLYSDTDSIFIKYSDLPKLKYPIGTKLGELQIDFDYDGYEFAQEAIFISKKRYCLKLDEKNYHFRYAYKNKSEIQKPWEFYLSLLKQNSSKH